MIWKYNWFLYDSSLRFHSENFINVFFILYTIVCLRYNYMSHGSVVWFHAIAIFWAHIWLPKRNMSLDDQFHPVLRFGHKTFLLFILPSIVFTYINVEKKLVARIRNLNQSICMNSFYILSDFVIAYRHHISFFLNIYSYSKYYWFIR